MRVATAQRLPVKPDDLGFFRYTDIAGRKLLVNDVGEWMFLDNADFQSLVAGTLPHDSPLRSGLVERGFLRDGLDLNALAERLGRKRGFIGLGPHLHVVITTLRCNQSCKYCHASRTDMDRVDTDMTLDTAKRIVDLAMQSNNPYLCFEYQGGEPTVRADIIKFIVEYSREKNRYENKLLDHSLVTNMTLMNEELGEWLLANNVLLCTSLDGPEELHNFNRGWVGGGSAYAHVRKWMEWFNRRYVELGRDPELWHVDALMTTTRKTFDHWKELIDLYVSLGLRNIHIRPLNPFGFANKTWRAIGYSMDEFMDFYMRCLDYILELNQQGVQIMEGTAATFLKKMLTPVDPNFVDIRSPVGAGTGQMAYNFDGRIFPNDEGRMVAAAGDPFFAIGDVRTSTWPELVNHPTVKAMAAASFLDALPGCETCFNVPFCGVRPEHNYMLGGDLFGQRPNMPKCKQHMTISRHLFEKLAHDTDGRVESIFRRWTIQRPRLET